MAGPLTIGGTSYGNVVVTAMGETGLGFVDAADPVEMIAIGDPLDISVDFICSPRGVFVMGNYVYVADAGEKMLIIVRIAD